MEPKYHKVVIYYFSGTGNAKNTAFWVGDEAKRQGAETKIINIAKIQNKEIAPPSENTLIGFISPTHGFHFPEIVRRFLIGFPEVKNCDAFLMNTRAGLRIGNLFLPGLSGVSHYWSSMVLKRKGFKIVGLFPVDLPSNWLSFHPAVRKRGIGLIYRNVEPKVRRFAVKIINGKTSYRALYDIVQDALIAPVAVLYILFGRYFLAKSFIASSDCDMCGLCEKSCPVQAIKQVDHRMFWTIKCESCMKCMNDCPKRAIETAHGFMFIGSLIISSIVTYLIDQILTLAPFVDFQILGMEYAKSILITILFFPIFFMGYRAMHWLMRFGLFERIFVFSSRTKYRFWGRYKAPNRRKNAIRP
ncbi:EFR1 family ferrodoxin [Ulvibacterium sp.]|uniref:EFR1 family ferrodoxin n=1 Tax=Ulvibacterium sp. TaxID=2665914 RepID=UPI003BABF538